MVTDGVSFLRRAQIFFRTLQARGYPNAISLARQCGCSKNTAQRTIYRLRDEYLVPISYDSSEKGYYLTNPDYCLPAFLPPGKDELTALLLAGEMIAPLQAEDVSKALCELWTHFANGNPGVRRDLEPMSRYFSCDSTMIADIADRGVLSYVTAAAAGESVRIRYRSPWRHSEDKIYQGRIAQVHFSDGNLYLLFSEKNGREFVLNVAFVKDYSVLNEQISIQGREENGELPGSENWLEGFGVWAGEQLEEVEVHILPPASRYYSAQRWHADQEDEWQDDILIRRFPSIISPELVRRVLSLGRYIGRVKPEKLQEQVLEDAQALVVALKK